jgi:hypothetical protein
MAAWLYPISKRSDRVFRLDDGTELKVSFENYANLVKEGRLQEDDWWSVSTNFHPAEEGDDVFIYTGDKDAGIVGYARILKVEREIEPEFHLKFDLEKCKALLASPVPAPIVRRWLLPNRPRSAVVALTPHLAELNVLLPWKRGHASEHTRMASADSMLKGAGFGDAKQNKKVEKAAVQAVVASYRKQGWEVISVEQQKIGYDLHCRKGLQRQLVEVKGTSGNLVSFIITAGERRAARQEDFVLKVVCSALSKHPAIRTWSGPQMERSFAFAEMNYVATLKD